MATAIEAKKTGLVLKAEALVGQIQPVVDEATARRVIEEFYQHVPPADVAERSPRELCGAALSLWRFAERRRTGRAKIRVYNPDPVDDGWTSAHTIVEIVNDDMPFLVDSVTGAINLSDRVVHLVIHPILTVERDPDGRLREIRKDEDGGDGGGLRESWMQIEITAESDPAGLSRLTESLAGVLADVRAAVADWHKMREVLQLLLAELAAAPPPLPSEEVAETRDFLRWLDDDNFTFLGYREYAFAGEGETRSTPLGILREPGYAVFGGLRNFASLPRDVQDYVRRRELLLITKSNRRSTVHRTAHMDAIALRRFDENGEVDGVRLFLGLFTSLAYSRSPRAIPLLRGKVRQILARSGLSPAAHDGKALLHILDAFPRDELFQTGIDELFATAIGVLNLQERQRIAVFVRRDPLERFVSCLVYCPRDRYDTAMRQRFAALLAEAFAGELSAFYTHLDDSVFARIQFIIRTTRGAVPAVDVDALERRLAEAGRTWSDRLEEAAIAAFGEEDARDRLAALKSFPVGYQARTGAEQAIADIERIARVLKGSPIEVALRPRAEGGAPGLRIYRAGAPVALSDILPIIENLGLRLVAEEPFRIEASDGSLVWVHELLLSLGARTAPPSQALCDRLAEALVAVWTGEVESDGFNRLVLAAGLSARQIVVLRLYGKFLRQAGTPFSQGYIEDTLAAHPEVARRLVRLFEIRFDPAGAGAPSLPTVAEVQAIDHALDAVASLDQDRILRAYLTLILKSLRTNYFQQLPGGRTKPYLAIKLASGEIDLLPLPRPLYEVYVYSPRVEAVHLRAGKVARGGIRWSDRKEDFRTEILGLMKAQTVKNAVIVPVGAKGGFIIKQPPESADNLAAEAVECYKILIRGLLDLTDNIVANGAGGHKVVPPRDVVRHDGEDPYLVVAADKGTATFSDYANAVAEEYGFWLGDAFASGGSAGYDHKALGITARGAFELVKRHFRELGRDIMTSGFTVVGVGDMSGDVFGNGMLMSRHIRLLAAFDHRHIFLDPDPDPEESFAERERLFQLPRSSWADYDRARVSPGGGIFERSLKSVPVSAEMKRLFEIAEDHLTPAELIQHLLKAPVDLLWFGGIGTFVKSPDESQAEIGDRANDALRVDATELRAKVVGEGANLGVSQRGRIAYALAGGRIDTDAIDNSAGVDTSDHEVNIKILVDGAIAASALSADEREPLLARMANEVASLVLRDNYLQGEALSVAEAEAAPALDRHARVIREIERQGHLDRALEFLPDEEALAERAAKRRGLVRPELAVLLAYAKMSIYGELLASDLPDLPELEGELARYFPRALRDRLAERIAAHPLKRELLATILTNDLVNRAGLSFVHDQRARTGRAASEISRAYLIVRDVFDLPALWTAIEALDNKVAASVQTEMLIEISHLVSHASAFLLHGRRLAIGPEIARLTPPARQLSGSLGDLLPDSDRTVIDTHTARLAAAGVPSELARSVAATGFIASALEIAALAEEASRPLEAAARVYYGLGARFALDEMREAARRLPRRSEWQKLAAEAMVDDVFHLQRQLALSVLASPAGGDREPLAAWAAPRAGVLSPVDALARELRAASTPDLAMLVIALRQLRQTLE